MKVITVALIGVCLFVISEADPIPDDVSVKDNEVPTSLIAGEKLALHDGDLTPHSRQKRSKKEALAYYLLYGQPPPPRYPRRSYGGYGRGNPGGYGYPAGEYGGYQPYYGYEDDYYYGDEEKGKRHGGAGKALKKLKKFG